jgi:hypothetical protein
MFALAAVAGAVLAPAGPPRCWGGLPMEEIVRMIHSTIRPEHTEFLALIPGLETWARIRFRSLNRTDREDAVADAIAYGYASFLALMERGKNPRDFPVAFSKYVVMAVGSGRAIGRKLSSRDVMSKHAHRRHSVTVHRFDDPLPRGDGWWSDMIADLRTHVADQAAFAVDFPDWLGSLSDVKQEITRLLAHGHPATETAEMADVSTGRVSQIRRELAQSWAEFHGDC